MNEMLGADVEQLRALAKEFAGKSASLTQAQRIIDGAVNQLPRYWQGQDAQRFASQWRGQHRGTIARTATMLDETAEQLKKNAQEQEQASSVASLGGAGTGGEGTGSGNGSGGGPGSGPNSLFGPDWLADEDSPFRNGWDAYNWAKLIPNMRAGVFDLASMASKANRAGFFDPAAWETFQHSNAFSQFANMSSDLFDGKWGSAFQLAQDGKAFKLLEGGGHALGVLGVGLDVMDGVNHLADGEYGEAGYSAAKAILGAASFAPPPVGTAAAVASGALFLYDNVPVIHDSVNYVGEKIADGAGAVVDSVADTGKKVAKFFGF